MEKQLQERSGGKCELCSAQEELHQLIVSPKTGSNLEDCIAICSKCEGLINGDASDSNHWRCLNDSMWSEVSAVKVQVWRLLNSIKEEGWPIDLLDMMYLSEEEMAWAKAEDEKVIHLDSNGVELKAGDSVTIIKDLNVKGSSIVAKRGTAVRNISLVHDDAHYIEGKVDGQKIVILTKFVKK